MKIYIISLYGLIFNVLLNSSFVKAQSSTKIRVDPKNSYGGYVSEYFTDIEYIPLETTKESLFGDIEKLIITDDSFVITDLDTRSILFFKTDGKFIKKIRFSNNSFPDIVYNGFEKHLKINYIDVESYKVKATKIFTISGDEKTDALLNIDEKALNYIPLNKEYSIKFNSARINTLNEIKDSSIYLIEVYKGDRLYNKLLPVNPAISPGFCYFAGKLNGDHASYYVQNESLFVSIPIENSIYKIDKDSAKKVYDISFPANREFPKEVLKITDIRILDSLKNISRSPNLIYNLEKIFVDNNKLVFKGLSPIYVSNMNTGDPNYIFNFIYDPTANSAISMERLVPDLSSYYLPVFNPRDKLMTDGIIFYKSYYYSHISSLDMFYSKDASRDKKTKYPKTIENYFSSQNRKSNPVLVRMKLK